MKRCGIEIRTVRPDQRVQLGVDPDLVEYRQISQRPEHFARQDGLKIDHLRRAIVKTHGERVGSFYRKGNNAMDGMLMHRVRHTS